MLNLIIVLVLNSIFRLSEQLCAFIEQIIAQLHERISKWRDVRVTFIIVDVCIQLYLCYIVPELMPVSVLHLPHLVSDGTKIHWATYDLKVIRSIFPRYWF